MKSILIIIVLFFSLNVFAQETPTDYNLGFEKYDNKVKLPQNWFSWSTNGYTLKLDSVNKSGGKYSIRIEPNAKRKTEDFGCIAQSVPVNFPGKIVHLSGKLKLENVTEGSAGLILRIDNKETSIRFDNMQQRNINGTIDWKEYSINLPLDEDAKIIYFGAIANGKGYVWADDINLQIDGVNISEVKTFPPKFYKAQTDREFYGASNIVINELNEKSIDNLYTLGKVWGFLKYYHPNIANGDFNWDYELFRVMPKIINSSSNAERDNVLIEWINKLGPLTEANSKNITDIKNAAIMPNTNWIKDENNFSAELISKLIEINNAKRPDTSYYIGLYEFVGNPKFKNEASYSGVKLDDGHRLLALFRYWNMIEYFFPNKHLANEDWNLVLRQSIPEFVNGKTDVQYHLNALKLIAKIHDSHANIWGDKFIEESRGKYHAPLEIKFIEEKPVVSGFLTLINKNDEFTETAFRTGDEIISVDGKPVSEIIKEQLPLTPGSNYPTQLRDFAFRLLRTDNETMEIEFIRDGKKESRDIKCFLKENLDLYKYYKDEMNKSSWKMLDNNIGYIYPGTLKRDSVNSIMEKLKNTKGIVIDFRSYPSDFPLFDLGKHLMPLPTPFVKFTTGSLEYPGLFTTTDLLNVGDTNANYYKGKIIIIVNETTQSSAEYHTMAWRTAPSAKVIGSTTAGADGNVSEINLPGGIKTMISGIGVLTPEGKETQRVGIIPDIEVKQTIRGFKEGKDELLEKAIELIGN